MSIFKVYIITVLLLMSSSLFAQKTITISGTVSDQESGETLIGAVIYESSSQKGTSCNEFGFYSLTLTQDTLNVQVSFTGYQPQSVIITESKADFDFRLTPGIALKTVDVTANKSIVKKNEISTIEIPIKDIERMPNLFGEVDIIKAFQMTPGVQSGGEGKNGLFVRGGSPDQNLILLDDVPLYNVSHLGGFFSVFNADAINNVKLTKGGFSARYGGKLSSVVDVRMKNGNMNKRIIQGSVSLMHAKVTVEAPIIKDKMSFMFSFRKNIDPVYKSFSETPYSFYDLNFKTNYIVSNKNRIYLSCYLGDDKLSLSDKTETSKRNQTIKWGNKLLSVRWNHIFGARLFSNVTLYSTNYRYSDKASFKYEKDTISRTTKGKLLSAIHDLAAKADLSFTLTPKCKFIFGASSILHTFIPNNEEISLSGTDIADISAEYDNTILGSENAVYAEAELRHNWINTTAGIRGASYHTQGKNVIYPEPRFLLNIIPARNLSVKYSYSQMNQFVHLLAYSSTGIPSDYWMPATATAEPENSSQHSIGVFSSLNKGRFEVSVEAYKKSLSNQITFNTGQTLAGTLANWEEVIETKGTGLNQGIELLVQKKKGNTTGWVGATVSQATRNFKGINNGKDYPFKYDRLLNLNFVANHKIKEGVSVSATWNYGTSYPITLADEHYMNFNEVYSGAPDFSTLGEVFIYSEKNAHRLRDSHRLDIAAHFSKEKKWGTRTWTFSIYNVYARQNPLYYYYKRDTEDILIERNGYTSTDYKYTNMQLLQKTMFGFFPSMSYSFKIK